MGSTALASRVDWKPQGPARIPLTWVLKEGRGTGMTWPCRVGGEVCGWSCPVRALKKELQGLIRESWASRGGSETFEVDPLCQVTPAPRRDM